MMIMLLNRPVGTFEITELCKCIYFIDKRLIKRSYGTKNFLPMNCSDGTIMLWMGIKYMFYGTIWKRFLPMKCSDGTIMLLILIK